MSKLRHSVHFRIHPQASDEDFRLAVRTLQQLGEGFDGIEEWHINVSKDDRKGRLIGEEAIFSSQAAFDTFHDSDKHVRAGELMGRIADWTVLDYDL